MPPKLFQAENFDTQDYSLWKANETGNEDTAQEQRVSDMFIKNSRSFSGL